VTVFYSVLNFTILRQYLCKYVMKLHILLDSVKWSLWNVNYFHYVLFYSDRRSHSQQFFQWCDFCSYSFCHHLWHSICVRIFLKRASKIWGTLVELIFQPLLQKKLL
jgi:hypothetical protein